ncbi:MAG TPA: PepSY domain-containing protein [Caulobacteraceae bacterium]
MTRLTTCFAMVAGAALLATAVSAAPKLASYPGQQFASMAKISLAQARATALKARPGAITEQELEKEAGGSGLRYSFDIRSGGKIYEIGVDARTGTVLENGVEGNNPD